MTSRSHRRGIARRRSGVTRRSNEAESLETRALLSATSAGTGLFAQYFDTPDLRGETLNRIDTDLDFDWGTGSPDTAIGADTFSARWSGEVESQFTETHTFYVNADDGARLWVNGELLVDQFAADGVADATGEIDFIAGRRYDIQFEYREGTGNASVKLEWSGDSLAREVVPTERLHPAARGGVLLEQFNSVSGDSVADLTSHPNFPDGPSSANSLNAFETGSNTGDNFGDRLRGYVHAPETGAYHFYIAADQSAELWLSNSEDASDRELIAEATTAVQPREWDANASQRSGAVHLVAGQSYYIEALRKEGTGDDHLAVGWQRVGEDTIDVIGGEDLSPVRSTVRIYTDSPTVAEGSNRTATFTVLREGGSLAEPLTVNYTTRGEATNGTDYDLLPGSITIPAGDRTATLEVTPTTDSNIEDEESVIIELASSPEYDVGLTSERTVYGRIQDDRDALPGGQSLWNGATLDDFTRFGATFTTESDPVFGDVIQADITSPPSSQFAVQLRQNIDAPVTQGDILFVEFRVKSIGGPGQITAVFERAESPFTKSLLQGIPVSTDWARIQIPFAVVESYAADEASFGFHLGHQLQTLQFKDFQVLNYGPPKTLAPETNLRLNNINGNWGRAQTVTVSGQPFDVAYEVETTSVPPQVWHIQALENNEASVRNGDTMRIEFYARATDGADPRAGLTMQRTDTFSSLFNRDINLTSDWQFFTYDIVSTDDFGDRGLQWVFNVGHGLQTVQIGGLTWQNLDNNFDLDELPTQFPAASYGGRSATDVWRNPADDRIADERRSDVTVNVTDANGNPLAGAVVNIRQNEHTFLFGSAINAFDDKLDPDGNEQALKYQSEINRLFNTVVVENSHKWPGMLQDRQRALDAADFAVDNNMYLRGHNAIWPSREFMPSSVWDEYDDRRNNDGETSANAWLTATIEARIADVANTFKGQAPESEVVNEAFTNHDVMDILGDDIVIDWYQQIRDIDPDTRLALNDFGIFGSNGSNTEHRDNFEYWLGKLNDNNLLDVIGEQSHYNDANLTDIATFASLVTDMHSQFNVPIAITEFDMNSRDLQLQADYLRDYMTMAFSQPAIDQFLHWGFWESSHWLPDAALYRADFSIKPNGQAYEDLVFGSWWSDIRGTTQDGSVSADVFLGEYDVVVQYDGQSYPATVSVTADGGSSVDVQIPVDGLGLSIADTSISEGDGPNATTLTVTRTTSTANDLVVSLTSSDITEAVVPDSVTIPAGEVSATVQIDAVDDAEVDRTQTVAITASAAGFLDQSVSLDVTDDDTAGFAVIETNDYTLARESGTTDTVNVVLLTAPTGNVVIDITSTDDTEASVDPGSLTFTPENWNAEQIVTVSAVDDADRDGKRTTDITFAVNDDASDDSFDGADDQIVSAITIDNDSPVYLDDTSLVINGTDEDDVALLAEANGQISIDLNGEQFDFGIDEYNKIVVSVFAGNDHVTATTVTTRMLAKMSSGSDTILGTAAADTIRGGAGRDSVVGNGGNDNISTASGIDIVEGGAGDDRLKVGNGADTVSGGTGNDTISGGGGRDSILGNDGNDSLSGGSKVDTIEGGSGSDQLIGGAGGDSLSGGDDDDFLDGENNDDALDGGNGRDVLVGNTGKDTLTGSDGEDLLVAGSTTLTRDELISIQDEWSSDRSHAQRLSNIRGDSGKSDDRVNSAFLVGRDRTDETQTVFHDEKNDIVNGNGNDDVFFAALTDRLDDRLETEWLELL